MIYAIIAVLILVAVACAVPLLRRNTRLDEVESFHVARSITTQWASEPQRPVRMPAEGAGAED